MPQQLVNNYWLLEEHSASSVTETTIFTNQHCIAHQNT